MTASTVPDDELSPPEGLWLDPRARLKRRYFVRTWLALRRLAGVAVELVLIAFFLAGFLVAAVLALNLAGVLRW